MAAINLGAKKRATFNELRVAEVRPLTESSVEVTFEAVSYTHLDVYKRQIESTARPRSSSSIVIPRNCLVLSVGAMCVAAQLGSALYASG